MRPSFLLPILTRWRLRAGCVQRITVECLLRASSDRQPALPRHGRAASVRPFCYAKVIPLIASEAYEHCLYVFCASAPKEVLLQVHRRQAKSGRVSRQWLDLAISPGENSHAGIPFRPACGWIHKLSKPLGRPAVLQAVRFLVSPPSSCQPSGSRIDHILLQG